MALTWRILCAARIRLSRLLSFSTNRPMIQSSTLFVLAREGYSLDNSLFPDFLDCVEHVRKGFIWAGAHETTFLLDAMSSIPSPNMAMAGEASTLTLRELQVVKCAARGKTNKAIAQRIRTQRAYCEELPVPGIRKVRRLESCRIAVFFDS